MSVLFEQYLGLKKGEVGKAEPQTALPVQPEVLQKIFAECLDDLNRRCVQGLLGEANPNMLTPVQEAQTRVDTTWKDTLAGKATLETFREVVKDWHRAVIALFASPQAQGQRAGQGRLL